MSISDEDNAAFNAAVHSILSSGDSLGDPDSSGPELSADDIGTALRLIWKRIGGTVTPTWREEDRERRQSFYNGQTEQQLAHIIVRRQVPLKPGDKPYECHMGSFAAPGYRWEYDSEFRGRLKA